MKINIIGAGMAGLLAGRILKSHGHEVIIFEKQKELPNNHLALLRFRSSMVSDITNIPFKKVTMIKATKPYQNPVAEQLAYAHKCFGMYRSDRSIVSGIIKEERFIAPPDFIERLAKGLSISFGFDAEPELFLELTISTVPMPSLMRLLSYSKPFKCNHHKGYVAKAIIPNCDAYATLYCPDPDELFYRISVTGDEMICEASESSAIMYRDSVLDIRHALTLAGRDLGFYDDMLMFQDSKLKEQKYAKIEPVDDNQRKKFIAWATDEYNIYSLGRFATWRPGLLLDDLVHDIKMIENWIEKENDYDVRKHR